MIMYLMVILVVTGVYKAEENALGKDVVIVDYEGNDITYTKQDLSEITHAYCCSIHKSQGSGIPNSHHAYRQTIL